MLTEKREQLGLDMTVRDIVLAMCEGNPGAINVMMTLVNEGDAGLASILILDDMNIRGTQIWCVYKDYCKQDIKALIESLADSKKRLAMVDSVNKIGEMGNHKWKAVEYGASALEDRPLL